jgi:hypothetical protein
MIYRETGQFKTSYAADQQIFPIRQDRIGMALLLLAAFVVVPLFAGNYWFNAILIPFLIFALAARASCRSARRRSWRWVPMRPTIFRFASRAFRCCFPSSWRV